ncbi:TraX family protein [Pseudomonas aeruginosa]|uniref:TraX family protein n=1 Tax=Pseudomonas aeruginosa group TaxID=136841 RepID=UPI0003BB145E|nr:TraX family protein [Pseudomonas aeruginosa]EIU2716810.1 conjugal transfer protein TraX [Pseudomonas aeruginosa]EIU2862375.1 conjugal transfer protein TraX [Pseudomonas aeruginosa]ELD5772936.1 conjugal transfer protein TraX [Pseudomonas aeruginosa]ERW61241.1 hypothetical protein Q024_06288 [Pseudomonas aeruginosa BWHPSA011]ETV28714.1 hypothetical protein Q046_05631 [Pseudomonas aeruginosa BWHPSA041]
MSWKRAATLPGIELVKWVALLLMVGDHTNAYLAKYSIPYLYELGRIAFPLFALIFAFNLARPGVIESGAIARAAMRLAVIGVVSLLPIYCIEGRPGGIMPINIMFTLLLGLICIWGALEQKAAPLFLAIVGLVLFGGFVEYFWPGCLLVPLAFWWFRTRSVSAGIAVSVGVASLVWINGNHWALLAIPIFFVLGSLQVRIPRIKWFFYAFYPLHLGLIAALQHVIPAP